MAELTLLDDTKGLEVLDRSLTRMGIPKAEGLMLGAHLESWNHPWLRSFGHVQGFVAPTDLGLTMSHRTGHFDHAPYATSSCFGPAIPTPFATRQYGQVFLVDFKEAAKARQIVFQVVQALASFLEAQPATSIRALRVGWFGEAERAVDAILSGLGTESGCGRSQEHGAKELAAGLKGLELLMAPEFQKGIRDSVGLGSQAQREELLRQIGRLHELRDVLLRLQEDWPAVIAAEEAEREARLAALQTTAS